MPCRLATAATGSRSPSRTIATICSSEKRPFRIAPSKSGAVSQLIDGPKIRGQVSTSCRLRPIPLKTAQIFDRAPVVYKRRKVQPVEALKEKPQAGAGASSLRDGTQQLRSRYMPPPFQWFPGLSGLPRCRARRGWSARLDIDCLGGLYGLSRLLDREMQHALNEMSVDGSVFRLEWQGHRSVE